MSVRSSGLPSFARTHRTLLLAAALLACAPASAAAQTVTVSWDPSTSQDLAGYTVHVGTSPGVYAQRFNLAPTVTTFTYSNVVAGQLYYFAVSAFNSASVSSALSNEVSWKINLRPTLAQPANTTSAVGTPASLQLVATDDGDRLTFSAQGLPPGLAVSASTGRISGTPTAQGIYTVTAAVSDGEFTSTRTFTWTVGARISITSFTTSVGSPQKAGTSIGLSAAASGGVAPYQFRFVATVGTTTTVLRNWSTSATYTWTPTQASSYVLAVWVRSAGSTSDVAEASATRTFVVEPSAGTLVVDNFIGSSGPLSAHPPDVNRTGTPWRISGSTPAPTISGGFARVGSGPGHVQATFETGVSDIVMHAMFTAGSGPRMAGLAFRLTDANNHLVLLTYNNSLQLHRKQNGAYALVATNAIPSIAAGSTHRLEVRANGTTVEGWWDGVRYLLVNETFQRTATRHGLDWNAAYDPTAAYDYFELTTPAQQAPPATPSSPVPSSGTGGVTLATKLIWSAGGATSYDVRLGTTNPPAAAAAGLTAATYAPPGLAPSTTYYWQVVARNSFGATTGPVWSFTTALATAAPPIPTATNPGNGATNVSLAPTLTWTAPGAASYDVLLGSTNPPVRVSSGQTAASYTPSELAPNTTYFWQIVARNDGGTTTSPVWSFSTAAPVSVTAPAVPSSPIPASGARGVVPGTSLSWTAAGATSYDVRLGDTNPPAQVSAGQSAATYTPAGLAADRTYYWQVVARNSGGTAAGPVWSFRTAASPAGVLVSDTFTSPSSYSLPQHTPDLNVTGSGWTVTGSTPVPTVAHGIARVSSGTGHLQATINSGVSDITMAVTCRIATHSYLAALAFRLTDADNHMLLVAYGNTLQFYRKQAGSYYLLTSRPIPPAGALTTHRLELRAQGSRLEGWWDGGLVVQTESTFQQSATRHGLAWNSAFDSAITFDNFELRSGTVSPPPSTPAEPTPASRATGAAITPTLSWLAAGATSYDVRFGRTSPPADAASALTSAAYAPGSLVAGATYYWQVIARNASGTTEGPVWSFTTAASSSEVLVTDTFAGTDGSVLSSHAPDVNRPGATWSISGASPAPRLSRNAVGVSAGSGHLQATLDAGTANVGIRVDCRVGGGAYLAAIPFRFVDANNHLLLVAYDNQLQFYGKSGGLYILLGARSVPTVSPGSTHRLELRAVGSRLEGWWDNVLVLEVASTFQQSATRHGLGWNSAYDPATTYDNFELRPLQ